TASSEQITASVGVTSELIRGDIYYWGSLMAGAVLASVPIVVLYVFFLDYYVSGLTAGAIKYSRQAPRRAPADSPARGVRRCARGTWSIVDPLKNRCICGNRRRRRHD